MKKIDEVYSINIKGVVVNTEKSKELSQTISNGYVTVALYRKAKKLHQLLAEAFIDNPNNYEYINHKDGNKQNNELSNLEWCDHSHNLKHAWDNGLRKWNPKSARKSRFNTEEKLTILELKKQHTNKEISLMYGCNTSIIQRITTNKKLK